VRRGLLNGWSVVALATLAIQNAYAGSAVVWDGGQESEILLWSPRRNSRTAGTPDPHLKGWSNVSETITRNIASAIQRAVKHIKGLPGNC
jgi:hypothetical protein